MVNIHYVEPMAPVPDEDALALFQKQWAVYSKFIDHDYGSNAGAYRTLHRIVAETFPRPFAFLDLACGDARGAVIALKGTKVAHYHGVDLAPPALDMAATRLEALGCAVELEHGDFIEAITKRPEPADVVWVGLSLHHLQHDGKRDLMRAIRDMIGPRGLFLTHEPTCIGGEDRAGYLDRYETIARQSWTAFTPDEMDALIAHVRTADYPESMDGWRRLGQDAGFARTELVFTGAPDLLRMFCFSG